MLPPALFFRRLQIITFPRRTIIFCDENLPSEAKRYGYLIANNYPHRLLPERHSPLPPYDIFQTVQINSLLERKMRSKSEESPRPCCTERTFRTNLPCAPNRTLCTASQDAASPRQAFFSGKQGSSDRNTTENRPLIAKIQALKQINSPCAASRQIAESARRKLLPLSTMFQDGFDSMFFRLA